MPTNTPKMEQEIGDEIVPVAYYGKDGIIIKAFPNREELQWLANRYTFWRIESTTTQQAKR